MKWSDKARTEIIGALLERLPGKKLGACSVCGTTRWQLQEAFIAIEASTEMGLIQQVDEKRLQHSDDRVFPSAALMCANCGNTHLLNLGVLGLGNLFAEPEEKAADKIDASPALTPPDTRESNAKT